MATENRCGQTTRTGLICNERAGHAGNCRGPRPSNMAGMPGHVAGTTQRSAGTPRQTRQGGTNGVRVLSYPVPTDTLSSGDLATVNGQTVWLVNHPDRSDTGGTGTAVVAGAVGGATVYVIATTGGLVMTLDSETTVHALAFGGNWLADTRRIYPAPVATDTPADPTDEELADALAPNDNIG